MVEAMTLTLSRLIKLDVLQLHETRQAGKQLSRLISSRLEANSSGSQNKHHRVCEACPLSATSLLINVMLITFIKLQTKRNSDLQKL